MRFLVDECTGPAVARWLRNQKHEVFSVYEEARGMEDDVIIQKAFEENWILITNDKDFGEKVYRERHPHRGVVFLRLEDEQAASKIEVLRRLLARYADQLQDYFGSLILGVVCSYMLQAKIPQTSTYSVEGSCFHGKYQRAIILS